MSRYTRKKEDLEGTTHHPLTLGNFASLTNNDGSAVTRTHNLQNQVTGVGSASLSFDANGNMTVDEQGRTFIWDAWNRLVEVKQGSTTLVEYQYDGLKRRIVEDDGTDEKDLYYSDQWQVLEERVSGDTVTQYVWSAVYIDALVLRDRDADANTGNGLEERIYVLHDANYNVTALTDDSGEVIERYYYEAYGRAVYLDDAFAFLPDAQSQYTWQHLHQGGRLDTITNNYYFRHRDLSPTLGRWLSQDPIGFDAGDMSLYRYERTSPANRLDPSGLDDGNLTGLPDNHTPDDVVKTKGILDYYARRFTGFSFNTLGHCDSEACELMLDLADIGSIGTGPVERLPVRAYKKLFFNPDAPKRTGKGPFGYPSDSRIPNAADDVRPGRQIGDRMKSGDDALQQLSEIEEAQRRVRQGKSKQIIDSVEKSKQRAKNQLDQIRDLNDLDDYDF